MGQMGIDEKSPSDRLSRILECFCASDGDDGRVWLHRPARMNGFAYASDGKMLVKASILPEEKGPCVGFQENPEIADRLAKSVDALIDSNLKLEKTFFSVQGLDKKLYERFWTGREDALKNYKPNSRGLETLRCPCCNATLYYDYTEEELVEKWKRDEEDLDCIVRKIVVSATVMGKYEPITRYYAAERVADVIKFASLRDDPVREAFVCGDFCLALRGLGWTSLIAGSPLEKDVHVIHVLQGI